MTKILGLAALLLLGAAGCARYGHPDPPPIDIDPDSNAAAPSHGENGASAAATPATRVQP